MVQDADLYNRCLKDRVHFETCPNSSLLTGSVPVGDIYSHSIVRFARDGANFSINSDDPTITRTRLTEEYETVRSWGLTEAHLATAVS